MLKMINTRCQDSSNEFIERLNFVFSTYVIELDENLDSNAQELKRHYGYVIYDLILHGMLLFEDMSFDESLNRIVTLYKQVNIKI